MGAYIEKNPPHTRGLTEMSPDWLKWVDENISRGCTPESIIDTLVQSSYDRDFATTLVIGKLAGEHVVNTELEISADPYKYEYESIGINLTGHVVKTHDRDINVLLTVDKPRIILFGNVLSVEECEQIIALSKPKLNQSMTVDDISGKAELHKNRTSLGTFFQINETPFISKIDRRLSELMQLPVTNGEGLQIFHQKNRAARCTWLMADKGLQR
jgi:prolyl 4-hydroxylase